MNDIFFWSLCVTAVTAIIVAFCLSTKRSLPKVNTEDILDFPTEITPTVSDSCEPEVFDDPVISEPEDPVELED